MTDDILIQIIESVFNTMDAGQRKRLFGIVALGATTRDLARIFVLTCPIADTPHGRRICELTELGHLDHIFDRLLQSFNC